MKDTFDPAAPVCGSIPDLPADRKVTRHRDGRIEWRIRTGTRWERILTATPIPRPEIRESYFEQEFPDGTRQRVWFQRYARMVRHEGSLYLIITNTSVHRPR